MRIRDQSRIDECPPDYDPNGDQFSKCLHVGGTYDDKGYMGGNIHKFDHINAKVYTLSALETFAKNAGYLVNSIMYSRDEDGEWVPLFTDVELKSLIRSSNLAGREIDIYIVNIEAEGDQGSLGSDSTDEDYEKDEDTETESDGDVSGLVFEGEGGFVKGESRVRVDEGELDEDVVQDNQDFNSAKGSDSEGEVDRCPTWNPKNLYDPHLKLKMIFSNKWEFIDPVHSDCVLKKRDIHLVKNDREMVHTRCKGVGCPWMVHANNITSKPSFQIRTYNSTHTCPETII
ncbi:hypothetical protein ACS0TY_013334 [Phlomoides rotata]